MAAEREDAGAEAPGRWGALAFRDFRFFWAHGLLQNLARNMRETLVFYLVWDLTGSELDLGITAVFQAIPVLVLGLLGGALADAADRKKLLIYTQAANFAAMALLPVLIFTETVEVWHLWVLTTFWSGTNILGRPAQRAFLPRLLPRSHVMNGITWFGALSQGTLFGGPFLAGTLIAVVDVGWALVVNSAILFFAIVATIAIRTSGKQVGEQRKVSLAAIWEGARFLKTKEVALGHVPHGLRRDVVRVLPAPDAGARGRVRRGRGGAGNALLGAGGGLHPRHPDPAPARGTRHARA